MYIYIYLLNNSGNSADLCQLCPWIFMAHSTPRFSQDGHGREDEGRRLSHALHGEVGCRHGHTSTYALRTWLRDQWLGSKKLLERGRNAGKASGFGKMGILG